MTQGSVTGHLLRFAVPLAVGLLFQQLYNTVDTLVVGRFVGREAQAAVGSTGSIINTLVGFCSGLSGGATIVIAQRYGAHDTRGLSRAVHTTILLTVFLSAAATLLGLLIIDPMLRFMDTPGDVMADAHTYLAIYFAGVTGVLFYNMGSGVLRAVGDSTRPLIFLIVSALLNTALDLLFVLAFGMKVEGVALATILSQIVSSALILIALFREEGPYGLRWRLMKIDRASMREIFRLGLPSAVQSGVTSFSNVFVQSYVNAFGSACMAGNSIYNKIDAFVLIPQQALSMSSATFVGQNWGARQRERTREGVRAAWIISVIFTACLGAGVFILAPGLSGFFSEDAEVVSYAVRYLRIVTPFYISMLTFSILSGALRGIGDATVPTLIMLGSFVVFRQIYLAVTKALGCGFVSVALAYPVGWTLCAVLMFIRYRSSAIFRPDPFPDVPESAAEGN